MEQDYSLEEVCLQIKSRMDKPSRLQLVHVLFGLSQSDGDVHADEIKVINKISTLLGISNIEYQSIESMFKEDLDSAYKVLGVNSNSTDLEIKKAYRRMANKFHPDKIAHLGEEYKNIAQENLNQSLMLIIELKKIEILNNE